MKKYISITFIILLLIPLAYSNGGCIKITDDVFVQMSHAPQVPKVNQKTSFLFSFGNNEGLINQEINGKIRITKGEELILAKDFKTNDGILDLKHIFKKESLYEIFLEFNFKNKTYAPEDFLIEVIENEKPNYGLYNFIFLVIGFLIGVISMKLVKKK